MKSASQITLSKAWWKKEAPGGLTKSSLAFEKALDDYARAEAGLEKGRAGAAAKAFEGALSSLQAAARQVAAEARELEKKETDKKRKAELANTQAVMGKPLARVVAAARAALDQLADGDADGGQFADAEAHALYIRKWAPKIKRGSVSFAIGLPSNNPEDMRFAFHMTKDGRGLANLLKKEAGARKFTFGRAGTLALAEEAGEEDANARTLCLELEGRRIPGLAKRVRLMLKKLGVSQFARVKVLEGGAEVDTAEEDMPEDAAGGAAAPGGAAAGAAPGAADPRELEWKARKAETLGRIQELLKSDRPDLPEIRKLAKPMVAAEREKDWPRALEALEILMGYVNGAPPVTAAENARLAELPPEELAGTDLTRGDMKELFSEAYMERLMQAPIRGEGDPKLKDLMREVEKGLSGARRGEVMAALSRIVGVPPTAGKLDIDYGRFLVVRKQQTVNGTRKDEDVPGLDEEMHPEFLASRSQLLFGKVLGDAFGIHEVFAALLSPTGGLVGPGNWLVPGVEKAGHLAPDNPVALHGTVHDAAGYLHTFHGEGPGYNYRDSDIEILGTGSPLSGQVSGIAYWVGEAGDDYVLRRVDEAVLEVERKLGSARDAVEAEIERRIAEARGKTERVAEAVEEVADDVEQVVLGVADAVEDARGTLERGAVERFETAREAVGGALPEEAARKLEAAWDFIRS